MKRISEKKTGALLSFASLAIQTLSTILLTPFLLGKLGKSEYGLFELVGSTVSYLSILGLGFSASYMRFYSRYQANDDSNSIATLNGLFITLFGIMSAVCIALGLVLVFNIRMVFSTGIDQSDYPRAQIIMAILVFNMALTFPRSMFTCNNSAHERFVFQNALNLLNIILVPVFRVLLVISGFQSIGLALASLIVSVIELIIDAVFSFRVLHLSFCFKKIEGALLREISAYTLFIFINQIYDLIGGSKVDVFIIGRVVGTESVAVYSVGDKFIKIFYSICVPLTSVFIPQMHRIVSGSNSISELSGVFNKVSKLQFILQYYVLGGFLLFGKEFIHYWIGEGYENAYFIALIIMASDTVALSQHVGSEIQRAMNKHKARSLILLFMNIGNIAVTIPLTIRMGNIGAAIATAICEIIGTILIMNIYYEKALGLKVGQFWKNTLLIIGTTLPAILIVQVLKSRLHTLSLVQLLLLAGLYSAVYILAVWLFVLNAEEKRMVFRFGLKGDNA